MEDVLQTGIVGAQFHNDLDSQCQTPSESQADLNLSSQVSRSQSVSSDLRDASRTLGELLSYFFLSKLNVLMLYIMSLKIFRA